jgi:hypothetical protein
MKTVSIKIPDKSKKSDYVLMKRCCAADLHEGIYKIFSWYESQNKIEDNELYNELDNLCCIVSQDWREL